MLSNLRYLRTQPKMFKTSNWQAEQQTKHFWFDLNISTTFA